MFISDAQEQRKKMIRQCGKGSEIMATSFNVSNMKFVLENSMLFARPQNSESTLAFVIAGENEWTSIRKEDIRHSIVLSTVDKMDVELTGVWVIETLTMSQSTTLFSFLDYQSKCRAGVSNSAEKECKSSMLVRTEKHLAVSLDDENKSMMAILISTRIKPQYHRLESLFTFIRGVESYWISYYLLCQMMNEDKESDCHKIAHVSRTYGVSESYFRKLCHDAFTRGPKKQLRLWRAAHSALQLIEEDNSISTIAGNNGYSSSSHFSSEIKSLFGITPREFKKLENLLHE